MADSAQRINAARQQEQALKQQLAKLEVEIESISDIASYFRVIREAYEIILKYQDGRVPGSTGIVLNRAVC